MSDSHRSTPAYISPEIEKRIPKSANLEDRPAYILDAISDCIDANTVHLSERTKQAIRRLNASIAKQTFEEETYSIRIVKDE